MNPDVEGFSTFIHSPDRGREVPKASDRNATFVAKHSIMLIPSRFLKKPNVAEGSDQFKALARVLDNQEAPQYAGFCYLAQARCEHSLNNPPGEAEALIQAARAFLKAEYEIRDLNTVTFNEHLDSAMNSYGHAIRVYMENDESNLGALLSAELATALMKLEKYTEAIASFERAAKLVETEPIAWTCYMGLVASCKIEMKNYHGALETFTDMQKVVERNGYDQDGELLGGYHEIMSRCEATRVLLLMLLKPTPLRIRPEHAKTLEKYTWETAENTATVEYMTEDLFLLLQSVVMACQTKDIDSLQLLELDIQSHLSPEQCHLLHLVIRELRFPSGEGL